MFAIGVPHAIKDGLPHQLALSCETDGGVFLELGARTFAKVCADICTCSPAGVSGTSWIENGAAGTFDLAITLNGKTVHSGTTGPDGEFDYQLPPEAIWSAVSEAMGEETASLLLEVQIQHQTVLAREFPFEISSSQQLALCLDRFNSDRIRGFVVRAKTPDAPFHLAFDGQEIATLGNERCAAFDHFIEDPELEDGDYRVTIGAGPNPADGIERTLAFRHYDVELDVKDNVLHGSIRQAGPKSASLVAELLLDGRPVQGIALKRAEDNEDASPYKEDHDSRLWTFSAAISNRWLDGKLHKAQIRIAGTDGLLPERPIFFQAGDPRSQVLSDFEALPGKCLAGWVVAPWAPGSVANVTVRRGREILASGPADEFSPALASNGMMPPHHGFRFELNAPAGAELTVHVELDGDELFTYPITLIEQQRPFTLGSAGVDREGLCFLLPSPGESARAREEARSLLFLAVASAQACQDPITIALPHIGASPGANEESCSAIVEDLVGKAGQVALEHAEFVRIPAPPLPSNAYDASLAAYNLDIWIKANRFRKIFATSRQGVTAYCADSLRQGLLPGDTEVVVLCENLSIADILDNDQLLDQPEAIFEEALERRALKGATRVIAANSSAARRATELLGKQVTPLVTDLTANAEPTKLAADTLAQGLWLVFAGPLRTRNQLRLFCDALDRVARNAAVGADALNIAIIGPDDLVRERGGVEFLRDRARKWPFQLRIHPNLTWDGYRRVIARFAKAYHVAVPELAGTCWEQLCVRAGMTPFGASAFDAGNPSALAQDIERLVRAEYVPQDRSGQPAAASLASLLAVQEQTETNTPPASPPDDAALPPLVSVCISHFNRPTLLRQTIASVEACNYPNLEFIVVDDGSSLAGIADELAQIETSLKDKNGRIVRQSNRYLGAARNTAAREAKGEFIIFMDDDNLAHPMMIREFLRVQRETGAAIVTSRFALFDALDAIDPGLDVPRRIGAPLGADVAGGMLTNCFGDANMLVTREGFEKIGGFTEDYGRGHEDWEFYSRAASLGLGHELLTRPLFWYREAETSMLRGRESVEFDLLRNIRGFRAAMPDGAYRAVQLAQGLVERWDEPARPISAQPRTGLKPANRIGFGRAAVVMRTKDRPVLLQRAIDSVINQTFSDWTLVIVNDGGDPRPVQALVDARKHALQGRAQIISNPAPTGMENASNAGLTNTASEFVSIHDDDDAWAPEFLERTIRLLDTADPSVGGVVTHATVVIEEIDNDRTIERERFPFKKFEAIELSKLALENQFPPISFLFRRSVMDAIGQFNGELPVLGDWDFHLRVAERFQIEVIQEPLAYYHHRAAGTSNGYANTVVAQRDIHRILRAKFMNQHLRSSLNSGEISNGDVLLMGDFRKSVEDRMDEFKQHLHWVEKLMNDNREHMKYMEKMLLSSSQESRSK
ncbi:glycosyltransferase family 2 protein [Novosphingobium profundi]|uniref:glycosyltransferase family 2 protein n=1 Tax=Novosphingobium profundi TaxID=1774954 RepID=UPI001CFE8FC4|nr:glycosyltransferase [Novosphingobium profundi]